MAKGVRDRQPNTKKVLDALNPKSDPKYIPPWSNA
jgi:hypothetical protein